VYGTYIEINIAKFSKLPLVFFKKIAFTFLICLLPQAVFAIGDGSDFLVIPSSEVLGDKAFQVRATLGYYKVSHDDGSESMQNKLPFVSSLRFGLFNSLELGVQFGSTVSLDVKSQINKAYDLIPAFAFGARAFVQSPEAYFYSIPKSARKEQTGEFYGVAEWTGRLWKLLGGVSAFPTMEADAVAPFLGYEQGLGTQKLSIIYEGFFRHGLSHHNMGLSLKPIKALQISVGASEFYRYFFTNDGDFKFRTKNPSASTGYRAPGIYASVAINAGLRPSVSQKSDIDSLKKQLMAQEMELANIRARMDNLEAEKINSTLNIQLQKEFTEIVDGYKSDEFSPDSLLVKEQLFMDKGATVKNFVLKKATDDTETLENRITAIRIMSHFPNSVFLEPLGSMVADGSNESIAREAALALGTINTPESRKILSTVANQTQGIVRETIIEIIGAL
jgi:hypothetical protein